MDFHLFKFNDKKLKLFDTNHKLLVPLNFKSSSRHSYNNLLDLKIILSSNILGNASFFFKKNLCILTIISKAKNGLSNSTETMNEINQKFDHSNLFESQLNIIEVCNSFIKPNGYLIIEILHQKKLIMKTDI